MYDYLLMTSSDIFSSRDIVSHDRLSRHTFDGLATGQYGTVGDIMDTFLQQQSQMVDSIISDIAAHT